MNASERHMDILTMYPIPIKIIQWNWDVRNYRVLNHLYLYPLANEILEFCPRCGHDIVISLTSITVLYLSMPLICLHFLPFSLRFLLPIGSLHLSICILIHIPKPKTEHNFRLAYTQTYSRAIRDTATILRFGLSSIPLSHKTWQLGCVGGYTWSWLFHSGRQGLEAIGDKSRPFRYSSKEHPVKLAPTYQVVQRLCQELRNRDPTT